MLMIKNRGFTIVELLIVIVVIAILAAISVVAYNGIQTRAENNKTITAATAYYKAIKLYEIDKNEVPHVGFDSCIGEGYLWDFTNSASGDNQCRYAGFSYYKIKGTLNAELKAYTNNNLPQPSMQTIGSATNWVRGVTYTTPAVGGNMTLYVAFKNLSACPTIAGQTSASTNTSYADGIGCYYPVGVRLR